METKLNLDNGIVNGLTFEQMLKTFIPKPLELGKHSVSFKAFDLTKVSYNEKTKRQTVTAKVHVDNEDYDREQIFSALDVQYMVQNICRQQPELAGQDAASVIKSLVDTQLVVDFWVVANTNEAGATFRNWVFYKPAEITDAAGTGTGAAQYT